CGLGESLRHSIGIRIVEDDVLAFEVTEIAQLMTEGVPPGGVIDDANARNFRRLLRARSLHLGRKQQAAATDQTNKLTPFHVEHGGLPPLCAISPPTDPCARFFRHLSLPQNGGLILGADLNCSESKR